MTGESKIVSYIVCTMQPLEVTYLHGKMWLFEGSQRPEVTLSYVWMQSCRWLWHNAGEFVY
jgi:hypothetical protein